ncbi:lipoprotein [Pandoraea terrae]|uniref:Lipoprotein n=1 Tax=Pandoraea terrae TaxID=1537710 RepID=A0A5E4TWS1_9BURK|nr:lipoprotein [Pandoraea terrae]
MQTRSLLAIAAACAALATSLAHAEAPVKMSGGMLVDSKGMTLYTFDKDTAGKSACTGGCTDLWPPVMAGADAKPEGDMTLIKRDDGNMQWAYKGKPVYLFKQDAKPGDMKGNNFKDIWHVVKP